MSPEDAVRLAMRAWVEGKPAEDLHGMVMASTVPAVTDLGRARERLKGSTHHDGNHCPER